MDMKAIDRAAVASSESQNMRQGKDISLLAGNGSGVETFTKNSRFEVGRGSNTNGEASKYISTSTERFPSPAHIASKPKQRSSASFKDMYSVGIQVTDGPPYFVRQVQSLMDENCVLQGMQGYKYGAVSSGDRLIFLDGTPVDQLPPEDVIAYLSGPMLSTCELVFESAVSRGQLRVRAMRHILQAAFDTL
jgi:hypothetical protein